MGKKLESIDKVVFPEGNGDPIFFRAKDRFFEAERSANTFLLTPAQAPKLPEDVRYERVDLQYCTSDFPSNKDSDSRKGDLHKSNGHYYLFF